MAIKATSQDSFQGGGKDWQEEHHTFQFDGTDTVADVPTNLTEIYGWSLSGYKPDSGAPASGQSQELTLTLGKPSLGAGTAPTYAGGVFTPGTTSAGAKAVVIARAVEGAGTADTDYGVHLTLWGRS